jgi:hypothetical protein
MDSQSAKYSKQKEKAPEKGKAPGPGAFPLPLKILPVESWLIVKRDTPHSEA